MRKYLFGTGIISAVTSGLTLLRSARGDVPFTWRQALAWLSWGITLALAIGSIVDTRRAERGALIATDSPLHGKEKKLLRQLLEEHGFEAVYRRFRGYLSEWRGYFPHNKKFNDELPTVTIFYTGFAGFKPDDYESKDKWGGIPIARD